MFNQLLAKLFYLFDRKQHKAFWLTFIFILISGGCAGNNIRQSDIASVKGKTVVYVYKTASIAGSARTWLLRINNTTIGEMTRNNIYRIVLEPGLYKAAIDFPTERFLGKEYTGYNFHETTLDTRESAGEIWLLKYEAGAPTKAVISLFSNNKDEINGRKLIETSPLN